MGDTENPFASWENNFREQMLRIRETKGLTQTDLAKTLKTTYLLPFHQQTIQRIESGERPVRLNEAHLIAKVLAVDLASMTAGVPSEREMRFAVDRLRRQGDLRDAEVRATMTAWAEAVLDIAAVIWRNWPEGFGGLTPGQALTTAQQVPEDHLDPVLRWGMAWAVKARWSFTGLLDAHKSLAGINPTDEEVLRFVPGEVLDEIASWADRYPAVVELARLSADDLNAAYPATDWSDEHRSSESDEEIG